MSNFQMIKKRNYRFDIAEFSNTNSHANFAFVVKESADGENGENFVTNN